MFINYIYARNNFDYDYSFLLWYKYNVSILKWINNSKYYMLNFHDLLTKSKIIYNELITNDIIIPDCQYNVDNINKFLDPNLSHHKSDYRDIKIPSFINEFYKSLLRKSLSKTMIKHHESIYETLFKHNVLRQPEKLSFLLKYFR